MFDDGFAETHADTQLVKNFIRNLNLTFDVIDLIRDESGGRSGDVSGMKYLKDVYSMMRSLSLL